MAEFKFDTSELDEYITDPTLESETGVTVVFPGKRKFRILRAGGANHRFTRAFQAAVRPHRRAVERGTLDAEVEKAIMRGVYVRYVVIDWDGIVDTDGEDIPYSPEAAEAYFETFPNLFDDLVRLATDMALFSEKAIMEAREILGEV